MKLILLATCLLSLNVEASSDVEATKSYKTILASDEVTELVQVKHSLISMGMTQQGETKLVSLSSSCGFAGCDTTYFASTLFTSPGVNPQGLALTAIVNMPSWGSLRVLKVLSLDTVRGLTQE